MEKTVGSSNAVGTVIKNLNVCIILKYTKLLIYVDSVRTPLHLEVQKQRSVCRQMGRLRQRRRRI